MHQTHPARIVCVLLAFVAGMSATARADGPMNLLDRASVATTNGLMPSSADVTTSYSDISDAAGVVVAIQPGADKFPGVTFRPPQGIWDLSAYGHVDARLVNTSTNRLVLSLRVDNAGDWHTSPWSFESLHLAPGAAGNLRVYFGMSFGKTAFALHPEAVIRILVFAGKSDATQSFRIESLQAGGAPGERPAVDPKSIRITPRQGRLLEAGAISNAAAQLVVTGGAQAAVITNNDGDIALRLTLPPSKTEQSLQFHPAVGRWDLRDFLEVRVQVRNAGMAPLVPRLRVEGDNGPSDWAAAKAPLAPGAVTELVASFIPAVPWTCLPSSPKPGHVNNLPGTGTKLTSDAVAAITVAADAGAVERVLVVESIRADLPPPPVMPAWLGKRPPVDGAWNMTFDDEFNGAAINTDLWNVVGQNFYDKVSHYSRDNVIVKDGLLRLRYEKQRGWHNDDPAFKPWGPTAVSGETPYATGYLDTFGKWTQRYGYFESRLKLPRAPGLWPAFWMMPDRGPAFGSPGKRGSTSDGGMEFDIAEWLSRWGQYRYNIAMHWDGYGPEHKAAGTGTIYVQPDADGFLTCGLLWTPGVAIYYCNGREVLRWEDPRVSCMPADLMFTMPCGGWDNNALDDAQLPADLVVDYVRVWQRADLANLPPLAAATNTPPAVK